MAGGGVIDEAGLLMEPLWRRQPGRRKGSSPGAGITPRWHRRKAVGCLGALGVGVRYGRRSSGLRMGAMLDGYFDSAAVAGGDCGELMGRTLAAGQVAADLGTGGPMHQGGGDQRGSRESRRSGRNGCSCRHTRRRGQPGGAAWVAGWKYGKG